LSLKEAEAAEAIRLRSQVSAIEVTRTARVGELNSLKERNAALELSCDELSVKDASLESQKDSLVDQVSSLEATCSGLCDQVLVYELFKEQYEVVHDEQVKVLNDKVSGLDAELMGMDLHLDGEFYPQYLAALGGAIGRAIDKGMQDGLVAGIDHGKAGLGLADVAAYNPFAEANYVFAVNALRAIDFPLLAQLESQKDASIADIIGDVASSRLSFSDVMVPLIEPLCAENLVGKASTLGVPEAVAATTALSTTFVQASSVPPILASDYEVVDTEPQVEASSSPKIIFEQETLETLPKHPAT
ncbi:hypothetical protein Tco_0990338, partial [Tanacetum coccineum]